jgi:hypothetical protein
MNHDDYYPTVDRDFLLELISSSEKVQGIITEGKSTAYILKGNAPISKRIIIIRSVGSQIDYVFSVATAIKIKKLTELNKWLLENRKWKDGAYIAT